MRRWYRRYGERIAFAVLYLVGTALLALCAWAIWHYGSDIYWIGW